MFKKLKTIGSFVLFVGILLLFVTLEGTFQLSYVPYILMAIGIVLLIIAALVTNEEKSLLCRIGLHKFNEVGRGKEMPAFFLYRCERCGKEKEVMKSI